SSLDVFFVLIDAWDANSAALLRFPQAFDLPTCEVQPLTPWLQQVSCSSGSGMVFLNFTAPLPAGAAVGLRLSPFALPSSYADVHPGSSEPLVQPMSLNIRLESVPEGTDTVDACHPAVWACGLYPFGGLVLRPSKSRFASFQVEVSGTWAMLRFAVNATLQFLGNPQDVLKISPPYGYSVLAVYGSSLQ
ncbi:unnamed protein product, partial [Effrenium voratum]